MLPGFAMERQSFSFWLPRLSPEEYKMALEQEIETQRKFLGRGYRCGTSSR
jgi:hypothetical protein